jgi:uncharacterized repeat protein (TIGR03803 family)
MGDMEQLMTVAGDRAQRESNKRIWRRRCGLASLLLAVTATALPAQTFNTLASFDATDGTGPTGSLVQGLDGNFYGITSGGGAPCALSNAGCGTVFKVTLTGEITTLHSFCAQPATSCTDDGFNPQFGLIVGTDGNFYGVTEADGANCPYGGSCGTVFKITPAGDLTTLYRFCSLANCADGFSPNLIVEGSDGNFYGTTVNGGGSSDPNTPGMGPSAGTFFKITPQGKLTTLYHFCAQPGCADGATPSGPLVQGPNGDFYGTTWAGGLSGVSVATGTVFEITPTGKLTTLVNAGIGRPNSGVIYGADGNLYGTAVAGEVFKVTPAGAFTALAVPGAYPYYGLVQANDGNLYGTTYGGGANCENGGYGCGTVFEVTPSGTLTFLYSFCSQANCTDGDLPLGGLTQGTDGTLYGTTICGGANPSVGVICAVGVPGSSYGTVFDLSVGLGAFVETLPNSGGKGTIVNILGTNLKGASSVKFNGSSAPYIVLSPTQILAVVPAAATTGTVQVVTPGGTLSSNVPFRIP